MYTFNYIIAIIISNVLCTKLDTNSVNKNNNLTKWEELISDYPSYAELISETEKSKCFKENQLNFEFFYESIKSGLEIGNKLNITEFKNVTAFEAILKKADDNKNICTLLKENLPQNNTFAPLIENEVMCKITCCNLNDTIPDIGCSLQYYIYNKIKNVQGSIKLETNNGAEVEKTLLGLIKESNVKVSKDVPYSTSTQAATTKEKQKETPKLKENENVNNNKLISLEENENPKQEPKQDPQNNELKPNTGKNPEISLNKNVDIEDSISNKEVENPLIEDDKPKQENEEEDIYNDEEPVRNTELLPSNSDQIQSNINNNIVNSVNKNDFKSYKTNRNFESFDASNSDGSNFFTYLFIGMFLTIVFYIIYHNKTKFLALILEGRRSKAVRGRRKHTAAYSKLDSNLEEAISSPYSGRSTQIIY